MAIFIEDEIFLPSAAKERAPSDKGLNQTEPTLEREKIKCQGGGAATQMPAEHYHSGSNPDLGFL